MKELNLIKRDNYIVVQGWMIADLNLKGNELLIYACIYGFSQAENQVFNGSLQYLANWTNSTKQGVIKCLKSLVEKGLILKEEKMFNGVKFCEYRTTKFNETVNNVDNGSQQSLTGGSQQSLPNKIYFDKQEDNKKNNIGKQFTPPTLDEVKSYCQERQNKVDPEHFIDYYTSNGWLVGKNKMKDWKAAVRTWERNNFNNKSGKTYGKNGVEINSTKVDDLEGVF